MNATVAEGDSLNCLTEHCESCDADTLHRVSVQTRAHSDGDGFTREPHRVLECQYCGTRRSRRLED